uniref:Uncharacterized protein n=1 Tax=uncultured prokaryote TaxID=198431 RepID=A0A0H5Q749_9ZZZZ|nr:hypothetical protein [uncultured prokaryote]
MTSPHAPLAHILATVAEVREYLGALPRLLDELRYQDAADLLDEARVQLAVLEQDAHALSEGGQLLLDEARWLTEHQASRVAHLQSGGQDSLGKPSLTSPGGDPDELRNLGYANAPLW